VRWNRGAGTDQVEDRRGMRMGGVPMVGGGMGIVGLLVVLAINLLGGGGSGAGIGLPSVDVGGGQQTGGTIPADDEHAQFVGFVIDDVQDAWRQIFVDGNKRYDDTKVVLFSDATQTGCGLGQASTGPFYCPSDSKVYLDLAFLEEIQQRFDAPGDFAEAYVIAHEVGHHVQNLLGISDGVSSREDGIKLELQADCFAGVWGHRAEADGLLEQGDLEEGLHAAAAVGDDHIQQQTQGEVNPDTFTHGTSEQRVSWFRKGFDTGDPERCDTFAS
jgi:predicted metalloprotease